MILFLALSLFSPLPQEI